MPQYYILQKHLKYTEQFFSFKIKCTEVIFVNALAISILIVFAVIGIIHIVKEATYFLYRNKSQSNIIILTPIKGKNEDAEYILRGAAEKIKWLCKNRNDSILCINCNMDEETRKICESLCREYGFIKLIDKSEIHKYL